MRRLNNYYTKLFLFIIITVIISCCFITGIFVTRSVNNSQSMTEQRLISSAKQKDNIYEVNINRLHELSEVIGNDREIATYFKNLKAGKQDYNFYQSLKMDLEDDMKNYSTILENAFFSYEGIGYMDGIGGESVGYDFAKANSKWYANVTKMKKHYLGELKKSPISGMPVLVSAYPVLDENNQLLAIFGLAINLNGFSSNIITNYDNSEENTIVIDEEGTVVAANDIKLIYNYNLGKALPKLYQYIKNNGTGVTYYNKDGISYIAAFERSEVGGIIIQSLPVSAYRNPIIKSVIISIILLVVILVGVSIITYLIAKSITKPIHILVEEFNDMSYGNYDNELPKHLQKRKDEFGILGNALTEMKRQTSQLIMNLSLANEEIEASLEEVVATEEELRKQNELLKTSENKLIISNEYNQAIFSVLPDIIYIINREGFITDFQERLEYFPYMPKEKFIKKNIKDVVNEDIVEIVSQKIQAAMETGDLQCFEQEFNRENEREIFEFRIVKCFEDRVIAIARNVTAQRLYQKQIEYLSYHDQLTGLHNRRYFEEELIRIDDENDIPISIIMADVNGLKLVNDSFGHEAGDILLKKIAVAINESYPSGKRGVFRIGGDEFVIVGSNMDSKQAEQLVKKITEKCDNEKVNGINLSLSFGWETKVSSNENIKTVLKNAEDIMYKKKFFDGPGMRGKTIDIIINTLHEKNSREEQHSHRVADLCEKLAIALNMPEHERKVIRNAGLLHDIGKIAIDEDILNKPGRLTIDEFQEIKKHPEIGYRIICSSNDMLDIANYILSHHERWDGGGYPSGLKGNEIPLQSRMIAIADTFDAMTSVRSYRLPVLEEEAAKEILDKAGTQFDPELAQIFVSSVLGY